MISTGDLKKGITFEFEGQPCSVLEWQHVKMGRGGAIVRLKLRNLRTGATFDRTCDAGDARSAVGHAVVGARGLGPGMWDWRVCVAWLRLRVVAPSSHASRPGWCAR